SILSSPLSTQQLHSTNLHLHLFPTRRSSDLSPCTWDLKEKPVFDAFNGIAGAQNNIDLMFDLAVNHKNMPIQQFVNSISYTPAKRFNLLNKGEISINKDADFAILDAEKSYTLKKEDLYNKNRFSPYVGRKIGCKITNTIVRGNEVYNMDRG